MRIAIVGAVVFVAVALAKPWSWAGSPDAARARAAEPHSASPATDASVSPIADLAATGAPEGPPDVCNSPSGWRFVTDEHAGSTATRSWLVVAPVRVAAGPTDPAIPSATVASRSVERLGFCAPRTTTGGWRGTLWAVAAGVTPAAAQGRGAGASPSLDPSPSSARAANAPARPVAEFLVRPGRLGAVAAATARRSGETALASAIWPPGRYVLEARMADGSVAWIAIDLTDPDAAPGPQGR